MNHTQNGKKIASVVEAWADLRPHKSFAGMTLTQFRAQVHESFETRQKIARLRLQLDDLLVRRARAGAAALEIVQRVVNGVIADPEETYNGALYERMGYLRKNQRTSGLTRKKRASAKTP